MFEAEGREALLLQEEDECTFSNTVKNTVKNTVENRKMD